MSRVMLYIVCLFILPALVISKPTRFETVINCVSQIYDTTSDAINKLEKICKIQVPTLHPKFSRNCWGYLNFNNHKSPFPTASLTRYQQNFTGSRFFKQMYKIFLPFLLATNDILKSSSTPAKAPRDLIKDINYDLKLLIRELPKRYVYVPNVRYNTTLHKADVRSCLRKRAVIPTPKKVQLIQYHGIMEELYTACEKVNLVISKINNG